jgi:hypothetical protein
LPSTSLTRAPDAEAAKNGTPPTARKLRTGELTPPGMCAKASANNASDLARDLMRRGTMPSGGPTGEEK